MEETILGECSVCGGDVVVPRLWMGVNPTRPTCKSCGAISRAGGGKTIPMRPARTRHISAFLDRRDEPAFLAPLGDALDRMVAIQMTAYPAAWTEDERREAAEEYLFGRQRLNDACQVRGTSDA